MKKLVIFTFLFSISFTSLAQDPDPDIFRTWYLTFVQLTDITTPYTVSSIEPAISPYVIIDENLEFNGEGACNSFSGTFEFPSPTFMQTINFSQTTDDCGIQIHNLFENAYFLWMSEGPGEFFISQDTNGLTLTFFNIVFGSAIFQDYPLSVNDQNSFEFIIYPNPAKSNILISGASENITKIDVFDLVGQKVQSIDEHFESINISNLQSGIYYLSIYSPRGVTSKKFIKL